MTPEQKYPVSDWKYEVANGDTRLGYSTWLSHKIEQEQPPCEPICCPWCAAGSGLLLPGEKPSEVADNGQMCRDDDDSMTPLTEYQCSNNDCLRSFWV